MKNPFVDAIPDAVNSWREALAGTGQLPPQAQVYRYITRHRDNPEELGRFFREAVDRGQLKKEHVDKEMDLYVKRMEGLVKKEMS